MHPRLSATAMDLDGVDRDLVQCFVGEELKDPRKTPWLTIDNEDVPEIVDRLVNEIPMLFETK